MIYVTGGYVAGLYVYSVCTCAYRDTRLYLWNHKVNIESLFQFTFHLYFLRQSLSQILKLIGLARQNDQYASGIHLSQFFQVLQTLTMPVFLFCFVFVFVFLMWVLVIQAQFLMVV